MCGTCGYETFSPAEKQTHMLLTENDPDHAEIIPIEEHEIVFELEEDIEQGLQSKMYA